MSFVNFLCYGTQYPSFTDFNKPQFPKTSVCQQGQQSINLQRCTFELDDEDNFFICENGLHLLSVDCSALEKARQIWKGFKANATFLRNGSVFLSAASLGTLYWKHVPGASWRTRFNLITALAASALAGLALLANYRKSQLLHVLDQLPTRGTLAAKICRFRNQLLIPDYKEVLSLDHVLDKALHDKAQVFFTPAELNHLFSKTLFGRNPKLTPKDLYLAFPSPASQDTTSNEGKFVNAYGNFRKELDFVKMDKDFNLLYTKWVGTTVTKYIQHLFDPDTFPKEQEKEIALAFKESYNNSNVHFVFLKPGEDQYFEAFEKVCNEINLRMAGNIQEATNYITNNAMGHFSEVLYGPSFTHIFNKVLLTLLINQNVNECKEWLEAQFDKLEDDTAKTLLKKSLQNYESLTLVSHFL